MNNLEKLVSENKFYSIVFDKINIYFFKYDIVNRTIIVPPKTRSVFRCREIYENMPASFADDFVADEYRESFFQLYENCNNGRENCECIFEDKSRQFLICLKLQITERDEEGNPIAAIGIIDNRKEIRKLLKKQSRYINAIVSNAVGYMEVNLSKNQIIGKIIDGRTEENTSSTSIPTNRHRKKGYDEFERWWGENMLASDKEEFLRVSNCEYLISCYEQGQYVVDVFCRSFTGRGNVTDNKQTYYLSKDDITGDIVAMCVVYDLTKQHQQERDMHHKNLVIQKLCDKFDAICYVNMDQGTMIDYRVDSVWGSWDNELKKTFSYGERVEQFAEAFVLEEDRENYKQSLQPETIKRNLQNKPDYTFDYRIKQNREIHYFKAKIVLDDSDKRNFSVIMGFRNVDEEAKQHRLLEETLRYAEHASKAKTNFLSNMSHDMRTPMNAIIGFTALAATHLDNKEKVQEYLKKITSSGNHLLSLINDILDMNRIESGK